MKDDKIKLWTWRVVLAVSALFWGGIVATIIHII